MTVQDVPRVTRTYPVVELFGPTIQGEGPASGERCWFLRLGGCDYRCTWCDSLQAVLPAQVREAPRMGVQEVCERLAALGLCEGGLLVLSGGNPALHHLEPLVDTLAGRGVRLHVETQATRWREWLNTCDLVVCSPKPPSAFAHTPRPVPAAVAGVRAATQFIKQLTTDWALKLVAFDDTDLDWACHAYTHLAGPAAPWPAPRPPVGCYLSAGTEQGGTPGQMVAAVVDRFSWLAEQHVRRPELGVFKVGLQAHVLAWPGELAR